jgi:hypothetical protein
MYHLYGPLAKKHEVWWLSRNDAMSEDDLRRTERMFARVVAVTVPTEPTQMPGLAMRVRGWLGYFIARYRRPSFPVCEEVRRALSSLLEGSFDAVVVEGEGMAAYARHSSKDTPWLLNTQNIPSVVARRVWQYARTSRERYRSRLSCRAVLDFEADTFPMFDAIAVTSEVERRTLRKRFPHVRTFCVPNGVCSSLAQVQLPRAPTGKVLRRCEGHFPYSRAMSRCGSGPSSSTGLTSRLSFGR